jgi:glycosyltransferase 2 family protein
MGLARGVVLIAVLGIGVFALVIAWGDAPAVLRALSDFPKLLIVPILLLTIWNYGLRWLKWQWYLSVLGVSGLPKSTTTLVFLSGFAMSLTPGKAGELTKSLFLKDLAGAPIARTAPIVFAERLTDGIAMLLLASAGLVGFRLGAPALLAVAALAVAAVVLVQAQTFAHAIFRLAERISPAHKLIASLQLAYDSARELLTWRRLVIAVGIGTVSWAGECLALYLILLGLGAEPGATLLNQATFALASASLVGSASLLPGGLGAAEGTVAGVLELLAGQPKEVAAAATLLIRACTLWFGVALGCVALAALTRRALRAQRSPAAPVRS